jgi:hypothetical protein
MRNRIERYLATGDCGICCDNAPHRENRKASGTARFIGRPASDTPYWIRFFSKLWTIDFSRRAKWGCATWRGWGLRRIWPILLLAFASIAATDPAHALTASSTAVTSSQNPTTFGQAVTITATVTGSGTTPTGSVALDFGDGTLGGGALDGTGKFSTFHVYTTASTYTVTATYIGDATYSGSSGTLQQTISKATTTTTVVALNNPAQAGAGFASFTATVSGTPVATPTGTVIFDFGDETTGPGLLAAGTATGSHAYTTAGTFTVTATYGGDNNYRGSSGTTSEAVNLQPSVTTVAPFTAPIGSPATIAVTVNPVSAGTPTGTVTMNFGDGSPTATAPVVSQHAGFTHTYASASNFNATATYSGDPTFQGSSGSGTGTITKGPSNTALAVTPTATSVGQPKTFTATVTPFGNSVTPTGTVTFVFGDGNSAVGTLSNGVATVTHTFTAAGAFNAQAIYNGDSNYLTSTGNASASVSHASSNTTLSTTPNPSASGQAVTFTATVTSTAGTPTGTVSFNLGDGTFISGVLAGNTATITHVYPVKGVFTVSAAYVGDVSFNGSTSNSIQQSVGGTTTTVTSAPNPSLAGQSVTVTATVAGPGSTPTGTMTFNFGDGTGASAPVTAGGTASVNHVYAAGGTFTIQANYSGDATFNASTGTTQQTVSLNNTTSTLTSSLNPSQVGQAVTFTTTASSGGGTPTGTVTFKDGAAVLGTATLASGIATFTATSLTQGSHTITANYAGSGSQAASTSSPLIQVVNIPADSIKLRAMQVLAAPVAAQVSGQAISGAVDSAITEGFSDGGAFVTPSANGVRFNFAADPDGKPVNVASADPFSNRANGFAAPSGRGLTGQPSRDGTSSSGRVDDAFAALAYAAPAKVPPRIVEPRLWLGWAEVRGSVLDHWNNNSVVLGAPTNLAALYGNQVNVLGGLTRRLTPNFLVGVLGGYETFDYRSDSLQGRLKGDGWTVGSYLGWRISQSVRFDAAAAYSGIGYDGTAGTATGSFGGHRFLLSSGLTGTYETYGFRIEPSARVYALWEREDAYVDSLGTQQATRDFSTGRASAGVKVAYPLAWMTSAQIAPYAGLYGDYYFNTDSAGGPATAPAVPTIYVMDGWSARAIGGVAARFANGAQISLGAERGGIGGNFALWTYRARASIPFGAQ